MLSVDARVHVSGPKGQTMHRRAFLRAAGAALPLSLSGCSGVPDRATESGPIEFETKCAEGVEPSAVTAGGYRGGDWPTWQGDAGNTGYNADASLPEGCPSVRWTWENPGEAQPRMAIQPAVHEGTVYAVDTSYFEERATPTDGDGDGDTDPRRSSVVAIDAETGDRRWSADTGNTPYEPPAVADGALLVPDFGLTAFDAGDGEKRWTETFESAVEWDRDGQYDPEWTYTPTVVDGVTYVAIGLGHLFAVDIADGEVLWSFAAEGADATLRAHVRRQHGGDAEDALQPFRDGRFSGPAAVVDGTVYASSWDAGVYAVDAATGEKRWRYDVRTAAPVGFEPEAPSVADGTVYVPVGGAGVHAVDAVTGDLRWRFRRGLGGGGSLAVADGSVYASSARVVRGDTVGTLYALDADTGGVRWRHPWDSGQPLSVADGRVFVQNTFGLSALDTGTGRELWRIADVGAGVAVTDGALFVQNHEEGNVRAVW
jgi:outer membrane protein assembly factor BamB